MGLLDINMNTPEGEGFNSALMAAAQALLTPRAQGGGMGAAFGAFPRAIENAQLQSQRARMLGLQEKQMGQQGQRMDFDMAQAQRQQAESDAKRAQLAQFAQTLPENERQAFMLNPADYFKTHEVAPGASLVRGGKTLFTAPPKADAPPEVVKLMQQMEVLPEGHPWRAMLQQAIKKATTHSPGATAISYGAPVIGFGPDGKPQYLQPSNRGGLEATGFAPAPPPRAEKPMPASIVKDQSDSVEAIGIASGIKSDMSAIRQQLTDDKIKLGPLTNPANQARNFMGNSTEESRNFATFKATLERMRNQTLILQKGVQTEGDAQRAWNEILANMNDKKLVVQRLGEIESMNDRAIQIQQSKIDSIREEYGRSSLDTGVVRNLPAAPGSGRATPGKRLKFNASTGVLE